jgi:hypothetical protein
MMLKPGAYTPETDGFCVWFLFEYSKILCMEWNGWLVETPELPVFLDMCSVVSNLDDVHRSLSRFPSWYSSFIGFFSLP